jgi:hypothetical protein
LILIKKLSKLVRKKGIVMTSAIEASVKTAVYVGAASYFFCYASNQTNAFEKAVLVTVLVGLRNLAAQAIKSQFREKYQTLLIQLTDLLAIPCTLYAGRVFNLKPVDYLHIVGLAYLGYTIKIGLENLPNLIP